MGDNKKGKEQGIIKNAEANSSCLSRATFSYASNVLKVNLHTYIHIYIYTQTHIDFQDIFK